ncbi:MAG: ArsR family transcriptional regulator [Candidatus Woesearchaeota archaeon]|nr:ArsR family transcriptional regulator [Candidatus Woesearchaeota archaeon]
MADTLWKDYSWVVRGKQRRTVLKLMDKPKTPTEVKKDGEMTLTNASRVLVQFEKRGLAKCLTPNETRSRVYDLTKRGKILREEFIKRVK